MVGTSADFNRRQFLQRSAALVAGTTFLAAPKNGRADSQSAKSSADVSGKGRIFKTVKWGMIAGGGSVLEKFKLQKELGYDGMELVSPWKRDVTEVRRASDETG